MVTITQISETQALVKNFKKITVKELVALGYVLSNRRIALGSKPYRFAIMEVLNSDKKGLVTFSYLYSTLDSDGVILPYGYDYYQTHPLV